MLNGLTKMYLYLQAYWRATHPPDRPTTIPRVLPSQEASPSGEQPRMGPTPPGS